MNFYEIPVPSDRHLLSRLSAGVVRVGVFPAHQRNPGCSWCVLEPVHGSKVRIFPSQQDLEFKFEVFPLGISGEIPHPDRIVWRSLMIEGPVTTTLLYTEEWLDPEIRCGPSYGQNPIMQCQGPIGSAPPSATAVCRYVGGVELVGANGRSIFIATGSFPFTLHVGDVTEDERTVRQHYCGAA
jgi:hypothetical protein